MASGTVTVDLTAKSDSALAAVIAPADTVFATLNFTATGVVGKYAFTVDTNDTTVTSGTVSNNAKYVNSANDEVTVAGDVTFTIWDADNEETHTAVKTATITESMTVAQAWRAANESSAVPVKAKYDFVGWYATSDESQTVVNANSTVLTSAAAYTAKFTPHVYTISYVLDGGTNSTGNPVSYTVEDAVKTLTDAEKSGYEFLGWFTDLNDENSKITVIPPETAADLTLYAKFEIIHFTVKLFMNGGNAPTGWESKTSGDSSWYEKTFTVNDADFTLPTDVTKTYDEDSVGNQGDEYTFDGWLIEGGDTLTETNANVTIVTSTVRNYVYTAQWTLNQFTVTFKTGLDGGTTSHNTYVKNRAVNTKAEPEKNIPTGYDFVGWKVEGEGDTTAVDYTELVTLVVDGTQTYVAVYAKQQYDVSVAADQNDFFTIALPTENDGKATFKEPYTFTITNPTDYANYRWTVTVNDTDGTTITTLTEVGTDGEVTISADKVTKPMVIKVEAAVKDMRVTVNQFNDTAISLVRVYIPKAAISANFAYDAYGTTENNVYTPGYATMYLVDKYQTTGETVFAYLVAANAFSGMDDTAAVEAAANKLTLTTGAKANVNRDNYLDVNGTLLVDYADVTVAFQGYLSVLGPLSAEYIPYYLCSDVSGDGEVNVAAAGNKTGDVMEIYNTVFPSGN